MLKIRKRVLYNSDDERMGWKDVSLRSRERNSGKGREKENVLPESHEAVEEFESVAIKISKYLFHQFTTERNESHKR